MRSRVGGECVARPGNRRAAEIQRVAGVVEHHLHDVGIERFLRRRAIGWHAVAIDASGVRASARSATSRISAGSSSGSSPCTLTTIACVGERRAAPPPRPGDRCRSDDRRASSATSMPCAPRRRGCARRRSRRPTLRRAARPGALGDAHDHRLAGDVRAAACRAAASTRSGRE